MKRKNMVIGVLVVLLLVGVVIGFIVGKNSDKNTMNEVKQSISSVGDVYKKNVTKSYVGINNLLKDYSVNDAINDNCFVVGNKIYNEKLYDEFMDNVKNKKTSFIRVVQTTVEGDLCIIDILYDKDSDKVYLVIDNTRDKFMEDKDKTISLATYENVGEVDNYFVAYNKKLPSKINEDSKDLFIIASIN